MKVPIHTPYITLEALLKFANTVESGGRAKELIRDGSVSVDGDVCLQRGKKVRPGMKVVLEGIPGSLEVVPGD